MEDYTEEFNKAFVQNLEASIGKLPQNKLAEIYRPCAIACVQNFVLKEMQRQFNECGASLDRQYEKYGRTEFFMPTL